MQQLKLNELIKFDDQKFNAQVLMNQPDFRVLLLCLRAGQQVPEHSAAGNITVHAITGNAIFYDGDQPCDMTAGTIVQLAPGRPHRVEAVTDSALLVTLIKATAKVEREGEPERVIDLSALPRPERHPVVFNAFDQLAIGDSFIIASDHDPQPLRLQIEQLRAGEMCWDYLRQEPGDYRIRLTRIAPPAGKVGPVNTGTDTSPVRIGV
jgi:uncharacterized protein (DUF2249 family)/quercetin dioxygenase-like cupin family protein